MGLKRICFSNRKIKGIHMQGSIILSELGTLIVFALIIVAGGYVIMTLRNINGLIKRASVLLQKNKHYFNQIIPNINTISENTANVAKDLKKSVDEAGVAQPVGLRKRPANYGLGSNDGGKGGQNYCGRRAMKPPLRL
jgi:hypothetical protein